MGERTRLNGVEDEWYDSEEDEPTMMRDYDEALSFQSSGQLPPAQRSVRFEEQYRSGEFGSSASGFGGGAGAGAGAGAGMSGGSSWGSSRFQDPRFGDRTATSGGTGSWEREQRESRRGWCHATAAAFTVYAANQQLGEAGVEIALSPAVLPLLCSLHRCMWCVRPPHAAAGVGTPWAR